MFLEKLLGFFFKLYVWYDNFGDSLLWFFFEIVVEDFKIGEKWYFIVNWWFVVEKGFGEVEFELRVVLKEDLLEFKNVFYFWV